MDIATPSIMGKQSKGSHQSNQARSTRNIIQFTQSEISPTCQTKLKMREKGLNFEDKHTTPFFAAVRQT